MILKNMGKSLFHGWYNTIYSGCRSSVDRSDGVREAASSILVTPTNFKIWYLYQVLKLSGVSELTLAPMKSERFNFLRSKKQDLCGAK